MLQEDDRYRRPYLDAVVFIEVAKGPAADKPQAAEQARLILRDVEAGRLPLVASTLIVAEASKPAPDDPTLIPGQWVLRPGVTLREVDLRVARKAGELVRDHGFAGADAVHVATAILSGCDVVFTTDGRMLKKAQAAGDDLGILVCEPYHQGQAELTFDAYEAADDESTPAKPDTE